MTLRQIEIKYGLPANIRIPLEDGGSLFRTVTRRLDNGHYMQRDDEQPHLGEFQMYYSPGVTERVFADLEYLGVPKEDEAVF